jgi:hypothetical protein
MTPGFSSNLRSIVVFFNYAPSLFIYFRRSFLKNISSKYNPHF